MEIKVKAYAKINLLLDIIEKRTDNYHELLMIMQSVGIYDVVTVTENKSRKITITCKTEGVPTDKTNIAYKAANAFYKATKVKKTGINIDIVKNIPHAAGLAGGSADGAAVLVALNKLYNTYLSDDELCKIGVTIGADVPFCIKGGTLLAQGIGEILHKLKSMPKCYILLAKPKCGVNTGKAYSLFDTNGKTHNPDCLSMLKAVQSRDLKEISMRLENVFEQFITFKDRIMIKETMRKFGSLGVCMSGSGPTVFGIFDDKAQADLACNALKPSMEFAKVTTPVSKGCGILKMM